MYAGRVRSEHIGTTITLKGWVSRRRNLGGLIFIDLRDREGLMQLVVNPENADATVVETAESLRSEFVIEVTGTVEAREQANDNLPTGAVELKVEDLKVLNTASRIIRNDIIVVAKCQILDLQFAGIPNFIISRRLFVTNLITQ